MKQKGFSMIEVVIGAGIITLAVLGLIAAFQGALILSRETGKGIQATFLVEEGVEALQSLRSRNWEYIGNLSTSTPYSIAWNNGWATSTTISLIDGVFERRIIFSSVYRNGTDDIAQTGTYDPYSKRATISVSYLGKNGTTTKSAEIILFNI